MEEIYDDDEFMDYKTQLKSKEWKGKRKSILSRDNNSCLQCKNSNLTNGKLPYYYHSKGSNLRNENQFFVYLPQLESTVEIYIPTEAANEVEKENSIYYLEQFDGGRLDLAAIKSLNSNKIWVSTGMLEVHHTYYQDGHLAWEYPDHALQTLCWYCHGELHKKNKQIPIKDSKGNNIGNMTACYRCFGTGRLPQYSHVQSGICFRCWGAKYEELIK